MRIIFSGGGTLGPIAPLLAVIEELQKRGEKNEIFWIGTEGGIEIPILKKYGVEVFTIPSGKLRRYFDLKNLFDIRNILKGFFASLSLLRKIKPDVVVSAGGFVSVPVHIASWFLRTPSIVHQQDVRTGLSNKIMSFFAKKITVSIPFQLKNFNKKKTECIGNPVRLSVLSGDKESAIEMFHLNKNLPTVFVFGGGTGAENINRVVVDLAKEYNSLFQIIHLTGRDRKKIEFIGETYHPYPFFIGEMAFAYSVADIVIARAGFNSITEIASLGKPSILIPIKNSHQEENAKWVADANACIFMDENSLTVDNLLSSITELLSDDKKREDLSNNVLKLMNTGSRERLTDIILSACKKNKNSL